MADKYPVATIGAVANNYDAKRVPLSSRVRAKRQGIYPYYGAAGVLDYIDDYLFDGNYVLIAEDGSVEGNRGKPVLQLAKGKFWVNNHTHVLQCDDWQATRYLYYALSTVAIRPYLTGSVQLKLNQANLNRIEVPHPNQTIRNHITAILGTLDDKIELNRRMNRTLEEMAQALFKSMFVDFDGHDDFVDSELGPIPRGWEVGTVADLATLVTITVKPQEQPQVEWEHYSIPAFDKGRRAVYDTGASIKSNKYAVPPNAILVSKLNPRFHRIWMPYVQEDSAICSTEFMPFIPNKVSRAYVYNFFWSPQTQQSIIARVTGTTGSHQRVRPKDIASIPALVPPSESVRRFDDIAATMHKRRLENISETLNLTALRDTLLPKLVSGELRVLEAERMMEAAA